MKEFLTRLRFFFSCRRRDELDEELQFHLEQATQTNIAEGMTPEEARRHALITFGGVERTREQAHEQHPRWLLDMVMQDIRYELRGFRRNPLFTITVIATLALGIGAMTAVFSVVDPILFRGLPYPHADLAKNLHRLQTTCALINLSTARTYLLAVRPAQSRA